MFIVDISDGSVLYTDDYSLDLLIVYITDQIRTYCTQ